MDACVKSDDTPRVPALLDSKNMSLFGAVCDFVSDAELCATFCRVNRACRDRLLQCAIWQKRIRQYTSIDAFVDIMFGQQHGKKKRTARDSVDILLASKHLPVLTRWTVLLGRALANWSKLDEASKRKAIGFSEDEARKMKIELVDYEDLTAFALPRPKDRDAIRKQLPALGGYQFSVADVLHLRSLMPLTPSSFIISCSSWHALERLQMDFVQQHLPESARGILARLRLEKRLVKSQRRVKDKEGKQRTLNIQRQKRFLRVLDVDVGEENKDNDSTENDSAVDDNDDDDDDDGSSSRSSSNDTGPGDSDGETVKSAKKRRRVSARCLRA